VASWQPLSRLAFGHRLRRLTAVRLPRRQRGFGQPSTGVRSLTTGLSAARKIVTFDAKPEHHLSCLRMIKRTVMIKTTAKKLLAAAGFELHRININPQSSAAATGGHRFEPKREDRFKWIRDLNIKTVLDVGANVGEFASEIHAILPDATIYSFEPLRDCYDVLVGKMSAVPKFRAFDFALGSETLEIEMHRSEYTASSSILRMSALHKEAFPFTSKEVLEKVAIKRLDDVAVNLDLAENILIKVDVQGFEDRVIAGSLQTIQIAKLLIIETSFEILYDGQPLFDTIYETVKRMGFAYHGNLRQLSNPFDGNILQAEAIFIKF
jgi:FkbM family methyltransferase